MQTLDTSTMPDSEKRFAFGKNWRNFIRLVDDERVKAAEDSLRGMLAMQDLSSRTFLDIGCGSGLFSLAARRLGATVMSFDYDRNSVTSTQELSLRYAASGPDWIIQQGSILDREYVARLGQFDIVYSWGVLHHTGDLWTALSNAALLVRPGGALFISLYNDQGWISQYWTSIKWLYNSNAFTRVLITAVHLPYLIGVRLLVRFAKGHFKLPRGMSLWHDMKDWLGGYPFEVCKPNAVTSFLAELDFKPVKVKTNGRRSGCNEFVFQKLP